MKVAITSIVLFLLLGAFFIVSTQNIIVISAAGRSAFVQAYAHWLEHLVLNVKAITGAVIQARWMP